jgi:hypothetical protein
LTDPRAYQFSIVPAATLSEGDPRDPFRFYHDGEARPVRGPASAASPTIEVIDSDQNRQFTPSDRYFYVDAQGRRLELSGDEGLKLLNYWADPTALRKSGTGLVVHALQDTNLGPVQAQGSLRDISEISQELRETILDRFAYWEADGHLDMNILEGVRIYTDAENDRWTGPRGVGIYFGWNSAAREIFLKKVLTIGGAFQGLEHFVSPAFTWQMFTTNFFSMVGGSFFSNTRLEGNIEAWNSIARHPDSANTIRRVANIQTAEARSKVARDHLQMTYTWSVVLAACFADPTFRKFWPAPWRFPRAGILYNYFANQFNTAIPALGRNPLGWSLALTSGFGLYEISKAWFDMYGGLRYGTTENRAFSAGATILMEAALLSKASNELRAFTGSGELTWANLRQIPALKPRFRVGLAVEEIPVAERLYRFGPNRVLASLDSPMNRFFRIPEGYRLSRFNLFGLKTPLPRPSIIATWRNPPAVSLPSVTQAPAATAAPEAGTVLEEAVALRPPTLPTLVEANSLAPGSAVLEEGAVTRTVAATRVATTETVLSRVALTTEGRTFAVPLVEGMTAEEMMAGGRTRVFGLPLLSMAAGLGVAIGVLYMTGYYNENRTPRDTFRQIFGQ